jgi:hypothetical protein
MTCDSLTMMIGWRRRPAWWNSCWRRRLSTRVRQRGRRAMIKNLKKWVSSREDRFSKILYTLSRCRIAKDNDSGDLVSSRMHVNEWDEVALTVQQRRRQKNKCVGGLWLFIVTLFVVAAHIYMKDLPRVTAYRNRLKLSLSKCIRHGLIVKINNKKEATDLRGFEPVKPRSEIAGTKPPYMCSGCFIHTYSNNMINRFHVQ